MDERDQQPFAREPWRRRLQEGADAPSETTDARIRAAARRPSTRRPARWWLPASLAASFVLAFLLVQQQFSEKPAPALVTESDFAAPKAAAPQKPQEKDESAEAYTPPESMQQPAPTGKTLDEVSPTTSRMTERQAAPRAESPSGRLRADPRSQPASEPQTESSAERESRAAAADADSDDAPGEDLGDVVVTGSRKRESNLETTTPTLQATAATVARYRSPEAWYAAIETLRADGRNEDADREQEQLEEAHPGWLKQRLAEQERKRDQEGR